MATKSGIATLVMMHRRLNEVGNSLAMTYPMRYARIAIKLKLSLSWNMVKGGCVYMMANERNTVLYTGVTSDLYSRVVEHKECFYPSSFTSRYNVFKLVYYESFYSVEEAIEREKQIKAGSRAAKEKLINSINPEWKDLFEIVSKW